MGEHAYHIEGMLNKVLAYGDEFISTIDIVHEMIHRGRSFSRSTTFTKGDGENADILLVTADTGLEPHLTMSYSASGPGVIHLYRGTDGSGGSAIPLYNDNQRSSRECETIATSTPSIVTPGTELNAKQIGSEGIAQTSLGGEAYSRHEWILDRNTKYLVRFSSSAAGNLIILTICIYEFGG